ncbi:MAG: P1 family peptidase, partial [Enterococcus gilvus]
MEAYQEFFRIGQYTDTEAMTGCTVILCEDGVTGGVSVRGGSPNTRDTDALKSENNRKFVHGVTLSGGSAFGLAANAGVVDFLEENKIGRDMGITYVPNVVGASLFDFLYDLF